MKRYILIIMCCTIVVLAYADCTAMNGSSANISRWQEFYTPVPDGIDCWEIELDLESPIRIVYNIDLDLIEGYDMVTIYEVDINNNSQILRSFTGAQTGTLISTAKKFRVEYYGVTGNLTGFYEGFQLTFEQATHEDVVNHNYYVLGKLGIGTTNPQATLHVNGSIYGGEPFGATRFNSRNGYVTIGTSQNERQNMQFHTDRDQFRFNKPILNQAGTYGSTTDTLRLTTKDSVQVSIVDGKVGIGVKKTQEALHINGAIRGSGSYGSLLVKTTTGHLEFGPMDSGNIRFKTNMTGYRFDKNLILDMGVLSSGTNLQFRTNNTTRMCISYDGKVGIGTTSPSYTLDVAGTIRANEIIVNTTGADFVFADDYQLRPLSEVKTFIQENKHLPEIKSAQEMQENGVGVNELQTQLLQKIEELTLYILQQEERIKALETELNK